MGVFDEISAQLKQAMRSRDQARVAALRGIRAAFVAATKENGSDRLSDEACLTVLRRLEKQRQESILAFASAGREDRAAVERQELDVIREFLPSLADEPTTHAWVEQAIAATGASSPRDLGRVMGALMKAHKGELDGTLANRIARELLARETG